MAQQLDPETREALIARLRFYRDLGLTEFYRRPIDESENVSAADLTSETLDQDSRVASQPAFQQHSQEDQPIPPRKPLPTAPEIDVSVPLADCAAALQLIRDEIGDCTRCALHKGRNKLVFGDGSPTARLMFVGEGPGADEDAQGLPFVGRAGKLLNRMMQSVGLEREDVYICNIVKCRPPGNRTPETDEVEACSPFLYRQIEAIKPRLICCLGAPAVRTVLGIKEGITKIHGRFYDFGSTKALATVHPAYVLRNPREEKILLEDFEKIRSFLKGA